jgi:hypothetical protein
MSCAEYRACSSTSGEPPQQPVDAAALLWPCTSSSSSSPRAHADSYRHDCGFGNPAWIFGGDSRLHFFLSLPSFACSDRGSERLSFIAPPGMDAYMAAIRGFVSRKNPSINVCEVACGERYGYNSRDEDSAPFAWAGGAGSGDHPPLPLQQRLRIATLVPEARSKSIHVQV